MPPRITASILASLLALSGCMFVPEGRKVVAGHKYSKEAIAFLDSPGVTREEAIANLGLASWENYKSRVLVYVWASAHKWRFVPAENKLGIHPATMWTPEQRWALLIGYDERGVITSHGIRRIGDASLEEACSEWAQEAH